MKIYFCRLYYPWLRSTNINARGFYPQRQNIPGTSTGFILVADLNLNIPPGKRPHPSICCTPSRGGAPLLPTGSAEGGSPALNAKEILIKPELLSVGREARHLERLKTDRYDPTHKESTIISNIYLRI